VTPARPPEVEADIFDLDGVIVDSETELRPGTVLRAGDAHGS